MLYLVKEDSYVNLLQLARLEVNTRDLKICLHMADGQCINKEFNNIATLNTELAVVIGKVGVA